MSLNLAITDAVEITTAIGVSMTGDVVDILVPGEAPDIPDRTAHLKVDELRRALDFLSPEPVV